VCRTTGATNVRFIQGTPEACDDSVAATFKGPNGTVIKRCQLDVTSDGNFTVVDPVSTANIWDPVRFCNDDPRCKTGALFLKVAPDDFAHPVDALRRYLPGNPILLAGSHSLGRVNAVDGVPVSEYGNPLGVTDNIVQPTQGAGPEWMKREFVE